MTMPAPLRFFLGAHSPGGYYSLYDWLINLRTARDVYILQGGFGSANSFFLRYITEKLREMGVPFQELVSTVDPDELDGLLLPTLAIAFINGSAPHDIKPKYPIAVERFISLDGLYASAPIKENLAAIIRLIQEQQQCFMRTYRCLSAARSLNDDIFSLIVRSAALDKISKRAAGVISRELKTAPAAGGELKKRFLSAVTAAGPVCLFDTANTLCKTIYEINDDYGLSHFFLSPILNAATQAGLEVIACYCPLNPENKLEHVLIPALSLGFVSSSALYPYTGQPYRRIRLNACVDSALLRQYRQRLRFEKNTAASLIAEASASLKQAQDITDRLESIYTPHLNDAAFRLLAESIVQALPGINGRN